MWLLLASGTPGLRLDLHVHAAAHLVSVIILLIRNPAVCHAISTDSAGEYLTKFSIDLNGIEWLPPYPDFDALGEGEAFSYEPKWTFHWSCLMVMAWSQISFGFGASLVLAYWFDATSRRHFEVVSRGFVTTEKPPPLHILIGLMPFASIGLWCTMMIMTGM